jgi:hypothetical protein
VRSHILGCGALAHPGLWRARTSWAVVRSHILGCGALAHPGLWRAVSGASIIFNVLSDRLSCSAKEKLDKMSHPLVSRLLEVWNPDQKNFYTACLLDMDHGLQPHGP